MNLTTSERYSAYKSARRDVARAYDEYEDMARECYREGYRPAYCVHGTYQWTDYDAMCLQCEDGITPLELAMQVYRARCERYSVMMDDYMQLVASVARCGASGTDTARLLLAEQRDKVMAVIK